MAVGDWYRQFGRSPSEDYFEIVQQDGAGRVSIHHFRFNPVGARVVGPSTHRTTEKEWLELVVENELVPVSRDAVPFLMNF